MKQLDEANLLTTEINELKRFIETLDIADLWRTNSNVTSIIKKQVETKTTWSIFGRRFFGCGAHEHTITVPTSMIPSLVKNAKDILKQKEHSLNSIFSTE